MRSATVSTDRDIAAGREATDLLILPQVEHIEIRDWKAFDPCVEAGYAAAKEALEHAGGPIADLRRMKIAEAAAVTAMNPAPLDS
jgi:NTE family protein